MLNKHAALIEQTEFGFLRRRTMQSYTLTKSTCLYELTRRRHQFSIANVVKCDLEILFFGKPKGFKEIDWAFLRHHAANCKKPFYCLRSAAGWRVRHVNAARINVDSFRRKTKINEAPAMKFTARQDCTCRLIEL